MDINKILSSRAVVVVIVLIILFPFGYSVVCSVFSQGIQHSQLFLEKPDEKYEACVRETTHMRFNHMDLLKEIRDSVVREGKRGEIGLDNCWQCHTSRERFCNQCHNAVNLNLDCFRCHYDPDYPEGAPIARSEVLEGQAR